MAVTVKADNYNISMRTNDNYILSVDLGYDITNYTPTMNIKRSTESKVTDLSAYLTKSGSTGFIINIPASILSTLNQGTYSYDCVLDIGGGSKSFLFGGTATIIKGLS